MRGKFLRKCLPYIFLAVSYTHLDVYKRQVMACVVFLESTGNLFVTILLALGIGLAFGLVQGFLVAKLEIQPFIVTLAGMFFARGMTTIISINPQKVTHEGFQALMNARIEIPWLGYEMCIRDRALCS